MSRPLPRRPAPALSVATVGGERWTLTDQHPQNFTLVVFYRGLHCPICRVQLSELQRSQAELDKRGMSAIAISMDDEERAARTREAWHLGELTLGYGLDVETAKAWGLYFSSGIGTSSVGVEEPALFSEPGLFLVRPDATIYAASMQSVPFARPALGDLLKAVDFVLSKDYPARGEVEA